jgi:two-component sensor histidine kinase
LAADLRAILDAHSELTFLLDPGGSIELVNRRALDFFGKSIEGRSLFEVAEMPDAARAFVSRCLGTNQPMVGSLSFQGSAGDPVRFRVYGTRLCDGNSSRATGIFLRCANARDDRFSVLARQIGDLNDEIRKRRHIQSVLEESLRERDLLVREIHHRVKNNISMLASMLHLARRETGNTEAQRILTDAQRRVASMASIQQVLYQSEDVRNASAPDLIRTLIAHVRDTIPPHATIEMDVADVQIPTDFSLPLTLIVNELVINAVKHGLPGSRPGTVSITFTLESGTFRLCVHNPGTGFAVKATGRRASGLGLVRGLVRQLHGSFDVKVTDGVTCIVQFGEQLNEEGNEIGAATNIFH